MPYCHIAVWSRFSGMEDDVEQCSPDGTNGPSAISLLQIDRRCLYRARLYFRHHFLPRSGHDKISQVLTHFSQLFSSWYIYIFIYTTVYKCTYIYIFQFAASFFINNSIRSFFFCFYLLLFFFSFLFFIALLLLLVMVACSAKSIQRLKQPGNITDSWGNAK